MRLASVLKTLPQVLLISPTNIWCEPCELFLCSAVTTRRNLVSAVFGGAGGLHICALADALGCPEIIVPNYAGVFSALGMLLAPRERQLSRTINTGLSDIDKHVLQQSLAELADTGRQQLKAEGIDSAQIVAHPSVDLCYVGQSYIS